MFMEAARDVKWRIWMVKLIYVNEFEQKDSVLFTIFSLLSFSWYYIGETQVLGCMLKPLQFSQKWFSVSMVQPESHLKFQEVLETIQVVIPSPRQRPDKDGTSLSSPSN